MKVYRNNIFLMNNASDVPYKKSGSRWVNKDGKKVPLVPVQFTIIYTGSEFQNTTIGETTLTAGNYYYYNGRDAASNIAIWELTDNETALAHSEIPIFNIMEGTYTGKDMGERSITAQIDFPSRIDFQIGDFVKFDIANLLRANGVAGGHGEEKFYIYTMPTVKKVARAQSFGKAFQHTVTFYPCQYELATVKMRDVLQEVSSGVIYTGYDEFSFYGGANTLMKRIVAVLNERFGSTGVAGKDYWSYQIADSINEDKNTALEKFQFDFSDSSVMDALLKLNDAEGVNTKFFINERMIYVGYKRPYITGVDSNNIQRSVPFEFMYGKTSHMPIETNYGNLFTLTKSNGSASPITRLYAYGADRNLHRFYCSDRIKTGRYVNKLMLPSFEDDGRTDYIDSPEGIARFGIREGTKDFENIYPSLRFFYYGNLRDVKYCIKLMGSGLESDSDGVYDGGTSIAKASLTSEQIERAKSEVDRAKYDGITNTAKVVITVGGQDYTLTVAEADQLINKGTVHLNGKSGGVYNYPIARVQCYRVEELTKIVDGATVHTGLNRLVESAPPVDLAVFCHATGKVVKVVLYADKDGQTSIQRQLAADGKIPTRTLNGTDYIVGSCFAVHDANFGCGHIDAANTYPGRPNSNLREAWFQDADTISTDRDGTYDKDYEIYKNQVSIHQIHYTDDHWITDVYEFESYNQERFNRQGYSAYCWPRVNKHYPESQSDNIEVNAVVDVGPVLIEDTDLNTSEGKQQQTFDIYLRDVGFKINEQTWFGDRVFLFDTCKINFLDGNLAGYEFEMPAESDSATLGSIYVPALKPDGTRNNEFFDLADNPSQAEQAYLKGAFWRIVAKRAETDVDRYWVPNVMLNANAGDHIVFLDIFMPDIYVRVAEQRLLKEAKKYLDANDDGDIQYSFDLDKVRPNEQPIFALQMREGAIMRVVDDDLDIGAVNGSKTLFDDKNGLVSMESMQKYDFSVETNYEVVERTREDLESTQGKRISYDGTNHEYYLFFDTLLGDANKDMYYEDGLTIYCVRSGISFKTKADNILGIEHTGSGTTAARHKLRLKNINFLKGYEYAVEHWDWKVQYCFEQTILTPQIDQTILPSGVRRYCAANNLTEFEAGKYYEVVIDTMEDSLAVHDGAVPQFALVNGLGDGQTIYNPEYTAENMTPSGASYKRYKYKFTIPDEFNDNEDYYPAILYASNGQTDVVHVRLMSIIEQDGERLGDINYVDLSIDTVTIKFHDNTREARVSLQEGQEPERLTTNQTEMVRTVTATVKEESRATAWAQLMDRVADAEQLQDQTLDFYQNLVIAARRHYIELLNLRNNIFDPDGTCKETFLQIMMLQVGADSMNYQLKYTHYSMNGHTANCGLRFDTEHPTTEKTDSDSGKAYIDSFFIGNAEEVLDHYVYTDHPSSGEGGRWYPQERNQQWKLHKILPEGQTTEIYPVYFIALKASLTDPRDCHWVCEPTQHATNELVNGSTGYFYFNWGILAPESESVGKYTLTETRGNAYMYGDNLICGQISTLAGNSYFDLTHGNFVLAKDAGSPALSYINGVLTISGINDGTADSVIERLKVVEMSGGENLFSGGEEYVLYWGHAGDQFFDEKSTFVSNVAAGKYIISYNSILTRYRRDPNNPMQKDYDQIMSQFKVGFGYYDANDNYVELIELANPTINFRQIVNLPIYTDIIIRLYGVISTQYLLTVRTPVVKSIFSQFMFLYYDYRSYYKHLTDAIKGSTEIAGGLIMTNVLMLKDQQGTVTSGMSGLNDDNVLMWGGATYLQAVWAALHNYQLEENSKQVISTLLKKDGTGKIGCFRIIDRNTISVISSDGSSEILISAGENAQDTNIVIKQNGVTKVIISGDTIKRSSVSGISLTGTRTSGATVTSSNQTIIVEQVNLSAGSGGWTVNFEADKMIYGFKVDIFSTIRKIRGTISIYLCGRYLGGNNFESIELSNVSYVQDVNWINTIQRFSSCTSALHNLEVRISGVQVLRNGEWGTDFQGQLSIGYVRFCTGTGSDSSQYTDKSVNFSNVASDDIVQIGRNGIQVSHKNGGFVQMLNDGTDLYVRMFGLPTSIPTGSNIAGKIYNWKGFLRVGGDNSKSANFRELGFTKFTLPSHLIVPDMEKRNTGSYEQNEMYRWDDGDVFINSND